MGTDIHQALIESMPLAVIVADSSGQVTYCNPSARLLLGVASADAAGRPLKELVRLRRMEDDKLVRLPTTRAFARQPGPRALGAMRLVTNGQGHVPVRVLVSAVLQDQHRVGTMTVLEDIRVELQAVEQRVTHAKLDVLASMARSMTAQAAEATRALSACACTIAEHYSGGTLAHEEAKAMLEQLRHSSAAYHRLEMLSNAATPPEQAKAQRSKPADMVKQAADLLLDSVEGKVARISIKADPLSALPPVNAAPGPITDALVAVLANAIEAAGPDGRVKVDGFTRTMDGRSYVVLRIRDSGPGMDKEVRQQACEPFFTTHKKSPQRGLGLTLASSAIEGYRGMLRIRSQVGHGTSIRIFLPCALGATTRHERRHREQQALLLVDDSPAHLEETRTALEEAGFQVHAAHNPEQGAALYNEHADSIVVAIVDAFMPNDGGRILLDHVREHRNTAHILLISGFSRDYIRGYIKREGWTYLQKPLTQEQLVRAIQNVLEPAVQ